MPDSQFEFPLLLFRILFVFILSVMPQCIQLCINEYIAINSGGNVSK